MSAVAADRLDDARAQFAGKLRKLLGRQGFDIGGGMDPGQQRHRGEVSYKQMYARVGFAIIRGELSEAADSKLPTAVRQAARGRWCIHPLCYRKFRVA